jgi:hypothetical protein
MDRQRDSSVGWIENIGAGRAGSTRRHEKQNRPGPADQRFAVNHGNLDRWPLVRLDRECSAGLAIWTNKVCNREKVEWALNPLGHCAEALIHTQ